MGNAAAAIMGGFLGVRLKFRKDCINALKKANAISQETAKTLAELGLEGGSYNKDIKQAIEYLVKKKVVIQTTDKFYLRPKK